MISRGARKPAGHLSFQNTLHTEDACTLHLKLKVMLGERILYTMVRPVMSRWDRVEGSNPDTPCPSFVCQETYFR